MALKPQIRHKMVTLYNVDQGSKEWFRLRLNRITGSVAGKLLTTDDPTPLLTEESNFKGNYYTERGKALEPQARDLYNEIFETDIMEVGFITNSKYNYAGYSPDGILPDRLIEIKCFNKQKHIDCLENMPFEVLAQVHFGMMICDLPQCDIVLYNPDLPDELAFLVINVKRNEFIERNIKARLDSLSEKELGVLA